MAATVDEFTEVEMTAASFVPGLYAALIEWSSGWVYVMFGGLLLAIILGTWAGAVADRKGRKMQAWFLIGFFIPVAGLVAAYVVKPIGEDAGEEQAAPAKDSQKR